MPTKRGNDEINRITKGSNEIGEAYVGTNLVFNRDAPVWMILNGSALLYSLDGLNYTKLASGNSNVTEACFCNGAFVYKYYESSSSTDHWLYSYDIKKLRQGIVERSTINLPASGGTYISFLHFDSDGDNCIVGIYTTSSYSRLYYSLDAGVTWNYFGIGDERSGDALRYIGNGRFWYHRYSDNYPEALFYFSRDNVMGYRQTYTLPDGTVHSSNNKGWCESVEYCDGTYYVTSGHYGTRKQYYGTLSKATGELTCEDITYNASSGYMQYLSNFTYIYNKYYAILAEDRANHLYVSTDGITFVKRNRYFPGRIHKIQKNNGKLCVYGKRFAGYIDSDEVLHYSSIEDDEYSYVASGDIISNKFKKI